MKVLFRRCLLIILCCLMGLVPQPSQAVNAIGTGLGVSGSFATMTYQMVPGETLNNSAVTVTFFNNSLKDLTITLSGVGPTGVTFFFDSPSVIISAKSQLTIPVSFKLSNALAEGTYPIGVRADIVSTSSGIALSGFAQLNATLKVFGEAGLVNIFLKDYRNQHFPGLLQLFRNDDGVLIPVSESESGELNGRLVPGKYRISATYQNTQVASQDFELKDKEELTLTLIAQTVFVSAFMVGAKRDQNDRITSVEILYTIRNLYVSEPSVGLHLMVTRNKKTLQDVTMMTLPELPKGEISGSYTVFPEGGFKSGDYGFTLLVTSKEGLILSHSETQSMVIESNADNVAYPWLIGGICLILVILAAIRRRQPDQPIE